MRQSLFSLVILIILVSCVSITPSSSPTPTSTPVSTKTPTSFSTSTPASFSTPELNVLSVTSTLEGVLFFDMNRSGKQDIASFIDFRSGEVISQEEPGLSSFGVCAVVKSVEFCDETDTEGNFELSEIPVDMYTEVTFTIYDPNAGIAELEMRYFNVLRGEVTIPEYEMNGYVVPAQALIDVVRLRISDGIQLETGRSHSIGLMQGFLLWPSTHETDFQVFSWFDLNPEPGQVKNYIGDNVFVESFFPTGLTRTTDQHLGMDVNYKKGDFIVSSAEGIVVDITSHVFYNDGRGPDLAVEIHHVDGFLTTYRHLDEVLVKVGDDVFPGQVIGVAGASGMNPGVIAQTSSEYALLHWDLYRNVQEGQGTQLTSIDGRVDVFRDESSDFTSLSSRYSYFTYDNHPVFSLSKITLP